MKLNLAILLGGKSCEHEISIKSCRNIVRDIDKGKYNLFLIAINKDGEMFLIKDIGMFVNTENFIIDDFKDALDEVVILPNGKKELYNLSKKEKHEQLDIVFPILHGPFGEDGTIQGVLKAADIPYVGPGILGSSVGMDKIVCKRVLRDAGINTAKSIFLEKGDKYDILDIVKGLGLPCFVKPSNMGSSVGVSKVDLRSELEEAINKAFMFDNRVLIEECINGREIECSVLGNENPKASSLGEVVSNHDFYSYEAKYVDEDGAELTIPVHLSDDLKIKIQNIAIQAYKVIGSIGLSRVDFFVTKDEKIYVNEINTMPGFTKISMYPKLWELDGIKHSELIDELINFGIENYKKEQSLKSSY